MAAEVAPRLAGLVVAGPTDPWRDAGFTVAGDRVRIGTVTVRVDERSRGTGILAWALTGVDDGVVDGLATRSPGTDEEPPPARHANGATLIDHLVVTTPDLDRTTAALEAIGVRARRTREAGPMRQRFSRLGEVILELVGPPEPTGSGPARFWGLAVTVEDLDATAALLGATLGPVTAAVQPGRRIATLRHERLGLPVAIAFLTPPPAPPSP